MNVRKFLYLSHTDTHTTVQGPGLFEAPVLLPSATHLCRSNARTVPSRDALTTTKPLEVKVTLETLLTCSVKVTKQRPLVEFHTFT